MSAFGSVLSLGPLPPLTLPLAVAVEDLANAFNDDVRPVGSQPLRSRKRLSVTATRAINPPDPLAPIRMSLRGEPSTVR